MRDIWIIGDIHGCLKSLQKLIEKISPSTETQILLCGDLINRGPRNIETLNFLIESNLNISAILGNHDLAFISYYHGIFNKAHCKDCFEELSKNPKAQKWVNWLRNLPLAFFDEDFILVHAGLYPFWTIEENQSLAESLHELLKGQDYVRNLRLLWQQASSSEPSTTDLSFALNVFTRMRYINSDKTLCLKTKGLAAQAELKDKTPWFDLWPAQKRPIFFGHWSALRGQTQRDDIICLDSGCVWQESLTAYHLPSIRTLHQEYCD